MIERLLAAERALEAGDLDHAGRLFQQVSEADPRNAIAVVGLAVVAQRRGDEDGAAALIERALGIDPDDDAALRLRDELTPMTPMTPEAPMTRGVASEAAAGSVAAGSVAAPARRSLLDRLRRLLRRPG
jgi:predicted TPR repeat methyltransferase